MTLAPGTRLGPYEITGPLGAGGMGEVYRARDTRLQRSVAVKVLPTGLAGSPEVRARFEREAKAVSSLNHPHICTLHDIGREGDVDYLVMELVEGETLAARLERGALPTDQLIRIAIEIADALEKAHRTGIVHRDLKPGNIMLTKGGAKLMDFGLARPTGLAASPSGLSQSPTVSSPLTAEGTIIGTFQYMAPEQLEGREADARCDLWALGAVLYEMATGRKAFEGKSQASLIGAIMNSEPAPIATLAPMAPPALERVVKACLAKDPDDRIQTAHDVRLQLEWLRDAGSQTGLPAPVAARRKSRERLAWILAAVATLLLVVAAAFTLPPMLRRPVPPPVMRFAITGPEGVTMTLDGPSAAISPDGQAVVFVALDSSGAVRLWLRPIGGLAAQAIDGTDNATFPFWSPDSRQIGFFADGKLKKVALGGGSPEVLCEALDGRGGSWGRNGSILFAPVAAGSIYRVSAEGGDPAEMARPDSARGENGLRWPRWLPDGKHFLFVGLPARQGNYDVYLGTLGEKGCKRIMGSAAAPIYAPPGYLIVVRNGRLMAQGFDARTQRLAGDLLSLGEAPPLSQSAGAPAVSASETGILAHPAVGLPNSQLIWLDRSGRPQGNLPVPAGRYEALAFSPDGRRLIASRRSSAVATDLWMIELGRAVSTRFTFGTSTVSNPVWSPGGDWIAYNANPTGPYDIYRKRADGTREPELLLRSSALFKNIQQWSPDGRFLLFGQPDPETGWDLWLLPLDGDRTPIPYLRSRFNEQSGQISPDGRWMAYSSDESGKLEVYVQSFPTAGSKYQVSTKGAFFGFWSASGQELGILEFDGTFLSIPVKTVPSFTAGTPRTLFRARTDLVTMTTTPDLQRFLEAVPAVAEARPSLVLELNWMSALKR
jgi:serine/threonine protein kinase/Tol biopolymer transport system component